MTTPDSRRDDLAEMIGQRRRHLGLSISAAARAAGIDRATWTGMERGQRRTEAYNYAGIERALDWGIGTIAEILSGGDPTPARSAVERNESDRLAAEIERIRQLPLPATDRLTMVRALIDLWAEAAAANAAPRDPGRLAG